MLMTGAGASLTIAGRKDLEAPEEEAVFTIRATCVSADVRFDTATTAASASLIDVRFPAVRKIMPISVRVCAAMCMDMRMDLHIDMCMTCV